MARRSLVLGRPLSSYIIIWYTLRISMLFPIRYTVFPRKDTAAAIISAPLQCSDYSRAATIQSTEVTATLISVLLQWGDYWMAAIIHYLHSHTCIYTMLISLSNFNLITFTIDVI